MRPFFGLHMPNYTYPGVPDDQLFERVVEMACAAEAAGFDLVTVMDHFYQIAVVGPETDPMLEAYTTLGALAARTSTVKLATMVTGVTYRNPALLAKQVTTLDVISKGRAILGIGAAWNEDEHRGYDFEFPPIRERLDRLEEAVQICRAMFREERPSFEGRFYRIDRALNVPRPVQPGGPRILIGGGGEKRTLRLVARYADISNFFGSREEAERKNRLIDEYCAEIERDPAEILRTIPVPYVLVRDDREAAAALARIPEERRAQIQPGSVQQVADWAGGMRALGFEGFIFRNPTLPTPEAVALAGELIASLA